MSSSRRPTVSPSVTYVVSGKEGGIGSLLGDVILALDFHKKRPKRRPSSELCTQETKRGTKEGTYPWGGHSTQYAAGAHDRLGFGQGKQLLVAGGDEAGDVHLLLRPGG